MQCKRDGYIHVGLLRCTPPSLATALCGCARLGACPGCSPCEGGQKCSLPCHPPPPVAGKGRTADRATGRVCWTMLLSRALRWCPPSLGVELMLMGAVLFQRVAALPRGGKVAGGSAGGRGCNAAVALQGWSPTAAGPWKPLAHRFRPNSRP